MKFNVDAFQLFDHEWALLTAGNSDSFNTMTISWGGLGTMWGKPVATVYVRPSRYTYQFMEKNDYFTVSFYAESYRKALSLLGTLSGRDCNKVSEAGLTPIPTEGSMTFHEARVTLLCKKIYRQDMDLSAMPKDVVEEYYNGNSVHTMYIGEVIKIIESK